MGTRTQSKSSRDKVRAHRKRLRQQGLRPIQILGCGISSRLVIVALRYPSSVMSRCQSAAAYR
jgi:hypothetical protein